jgi:ribosome-associated toxin RatA of RatAB toxin-antitoxin module
VAAVGTLTASWTVEIEASRKRVYAVAADVPASPAWQPALETVETLESDEQGRATLVDTSSDAVVKKTRQRLRFSYDDEPAGMSWVQIEGDVKSLEGSWEFVELTAERTEATFALAVDPGRVLGMLLRGPVEGKVKEFLTKGAAEGLKEHVESTAGG